MTTQLSDEPAADRWKERRRFRKFRGVTGSRSCTMIKCPRGCSRRNTDNNCELGPVLLRKGSRTHIMQPSAAFDKFSESIKVVKGEDAATFAPLDPESTGGIGGTSAEVFGPEVCLGHASNAAVVLRKL